MCVCVCVKESGVICEKGSQSNDLSNEPGVIGKNKNKNKKRRRKMMMKVMAVITANNFNDQTNESSKQQKPINPRGVNQRVARIKKAVWQVKEKGASGR